MNRMAAVRRYLINILSYMQTFRLTSTDLILTRTSVAYFRYERA
jgi:hypothetical protein